MHNYLKILSSGLLFHIKTDQSLVRNLMARDEFWLLSNNTTFINVAEEKPQENNCGASFQRIESSMVTVGMVGKCQKEVVIKQRAKSTFHQFHLLCGIKIPTCAAAAQPSARCERCPTWGSHRLHHSACLTTARTT